VQQAAGKAQVLAAPCRLLQRLVQLKQLGWVMKLVAASKLSVQSFLRM
jgi:hypothetical protein